MVTRRTIPKLDWASKYQNSEIDWSHLGNIPIAVIAAVSREKGVEAIMCFKKSVNVLKFKIFLEEIRR